MQITWRLPETLGTIGGILLIFAVAIQLILPKHSKVAVQFALVGGFGVGGAVGGWIGRALAGTSGKIADMSSRFTYEAVGAAFPAVAFAILAFFFFKKAGKGGKGLDSKGNGVGLKVKHMCWLFAFALLGCGLAAIPGLYGLLNGIVGGVMGWGNAALGL